MSSLVDGPFSGLEPCAFKRFAAHINQTTCIASNTTCLCMDSVFTTQALGATTLECGVKAGLSATNFTMSTCQVPEASQALVSPVLAGVLGLFALIMVLIRLVGRSVFNRVLGSDDYLIAAALICAGPLNCLMFPMSHLGLGTNIWTIPFDHITRQLEMLYVAEICYMAAEALTQLSFLSFYLRIFPIEHFQRVVYILMGFSICFGISNTFVMIFQCTPVTFFWQGWTGEYAGSCIDINGYSWYKAIIQIVMDIAIIALPIWPLLKTSMNARKKFQILLMFCTGFAITVISCLRLGSLIKFSKSTNTTYYNTPAVYWSVAECDIAIACACMPCIPTMLKNIAPSLFGLPSNKQYNSITPQRRKDNGSSGGTPRNRAPKDPQWQVISSESEIELVDMIGFRSSARTPV